MNRRPRHGRDRRPRAPRIGLRTLALALLSAMAACLGGCNTGSETGNPTKGLTGTLKTPGGLPAAHTQVILVPSDFNPLELVWEHPAQLSMDTTDAKGRYHFAEPELGVYNLEALNLKDGTRLLVKDVRVTGGQDVAPERALRPAGKIVHTFQGASDTVDGYVFIPGTTFHEKVAASSGAVAFDSLPAGKVDSLVYGNPQGSVPSKAIARNLEVMPETTLAVSSAYLGWKHSAPVRLDTRAPGIALGGNVTRIPLRIALTAPSFDFAAARPDGADLRATSGNGKALPCEVQAWDPGAGTGQVWVLVDTVFADSLQSIRLHWGLPAGGPLPPGWVQGSVFSLDEGYVAAWHLDEDPFTTIGFMLDRSGRSNDGTAIGFTAAGGAAAGVIGNAIAFDGTSQFLASRKSFANPGVFTVTAWFKTTTTAGGRIFEFADKDASQEPNYWDRLIHMYRDGTIHYGIYPPDTPGTPMPTPSKYKILRTAKPLNDGQWHHAAARLGPKGQSLFVDGVLVAEDTTMVEAQNITGFWRLGYGTLTGWAPAGTSTFFQGAMDEVWVAHAERSDDFIRLAYENQKPGSRLITFP